MIEIIESDCIDLKDYDLQPVNMVYADPPFFLQKNLISFKDSWKSLETYVQYITSRLKVCWDILDSNGIMLVHLDWHAVHYIKVELDKLFGYETFLNEIIWKYNSGGASKRALARKHDTILVYNKGKDYTFNIIREPYATQNVQNREGFHPDGRMLTDVWDISFLSTTSKERTGYSTQKPEALLERIISIYTKSDQTILDPFAGSGTTGAVATRMGRHAILCDNNPEAILSIEQRLSLKRASSL